MIFRSKVFREMFLMLCLIFLATGAFADSGVIAIVNKEVITQNDLDEFVNFTRVQLLSKYSKEEAQKQITLMLPDLISRLIEDRLILQAAYKQEIVVDSSRVEARIKQIKRNYPEDVDFSEILAAQGLSLADVELKIREQILMRTIVEIKVMSKVAVKPAEVTEFYSEHVKDFVQPEKRLARFTIIDDSMIEEIKLLVSQGSDLEAITQKYSLDITELGWVHKQQLRDEIASIVFELEVDKLFLALDLSDKYIFELKDVKPPHEASLAEMQAEINEVLFESKTQEELTKWVEELKNEAYIEIKIDDIPNSTIE